MILKNQIFRQTEFKRKTQIEYFGKLINIVTLEDLILSKLIWIQDFQSAIQMEDIRLLLTSEKLDLKHIKQWVSKLNLFTFNFL